MTRVQVEESTGLTTREWSRTLPPEMMAAAATRLAWLGLIYAASVLVSSLAIKLIRADRLGSSQQTRDSLVHRFEREAKDTARLGSTHTIDVYDFGVTEEGDFYYVMELLAESASRLMTGVTGKPRPNSSLRGSVGAEYFR